MYKFIVDARAAARASTINLYIIFVLQAQKLLMCYWKTELIESYQGFLEFYSSWCARNSVIMTPTDRFFPCQTRLKKFSPQKEIIQLGSPITSLKRKMCLSSAIMSSRFCFSWSPSLGSSMIVAVFLFFFYRAVSSGNFSSANDCHPF